MFQPLKGIKVIDLTYFVAGPGAAKILADWGADVIKVEPSFGDPGRTSGSTMSAPTEKSLNPFYTAYNANKRGLSLNLKTQKGKEVLFKILEKSDVFLTSYRTGALQRLGLDYASLHDDFPHLVWAQINGFGDFGPIKDNPGFDTVAFWARSGAMMDLPERETSPLNPLIGFGDATTSCSVAGGIAAALVEKQKTGKGCKVMVSLFGQAIWNASAGVVSTQYGDIYPKARLEPGSPVMNTYKSSDGRWFYISILVPDRYNGELLKLLGREDIANDPRFATAEGSKENSAEMVQILSKEFSKHTMQEITNMLTKADIAHEILQHFAEVAKDPQAIANKYVVSVKNLDGSETMQAMTPVRFCEQEPKSVEDIAPPVNCQAPLVGADSKEILLEFGYSESEIENLLLENVVTIDTLD